MSLTLVVVGHLSEQLKNETTKIVTNAVSTVLGIRDGVGVRPAVGIPLGTRDGTTDGELVWFTVELLDGTEPGKLEGTLEGYEVYAAPVAFALLRHLFLLPHLMPLSLQALYYTTLEMHLHQRMLIIQ